MSYSFAVRRATKTLALVAVTEELAKVVANQPAHKHDADTALVAAAQQINLIADDDSKDVCVSCHGYLSWTGAYGFDDFKVTTASTGCTASLVDRMAPSQEVVHQPV